MDYLLKKDIQAHNFFYLWSTVVLLLKILTLAIYDFKI